MKRLITIALLLCFACSCSYTRLTPKGRKNVRTVSGSAMVVGALSLVAGTYLVWKDGQGTCDLQGMQVECPEVYDTYNTGKNLVWTGNAINLFALGLFVWHEVSWYRDRREARQDREE